MFSLHTLVSLAQQMARSIPEASSRFPWHKKTASLSSGDRVGSID